MPAGPADKEVNALRLQLRLFILAGLLFGVFVAGCAPTVRVVGKDAIISEEAKQAQETGRKEGYEEAVVVCRAENEANVQGFMRSYKNEMLYVEAVKAGVLKPGQVRMVYSPGKVSEDGSSFSAPTLTWKLASPPQFMAEEAMAWWKRDEVNYCYFILKSYESETMALKAVGSIDKPDHIFLTSMPYSDTSGKWAVIGKAVAVKCDEAITALKGKGFNALRVK